MLGLATQQAIGVLPVRAEDRPALTVVVRGDRPMASPAPHQESGSVSQGPTNPDRFRGRVRTQVARRVPMRQLEQPRRHPGASRTSEHSEGGARKAPLSPIREHSDFSFVMPDLRPKDSHLSRGPWIDSTSLKVVHRHRVGADRDPIEERGHVEPRNVPRWSSLST